MNLNDRIKQRKEKIKLGSQTNIVVPEEIKHQVEEELNRKLVGFYDEWATITYYSFDTLCKIDTGVNMENIYGEVWNCASRADQKKAVFDWLCEEGFDVRWENEAIRVGVR